MTPLVLLVVVALLLSQRRVRERVARRMLADPRPDPRLEAEVERLRQEVETLRLGLEEAHERLDFTERLLARTDAPNLH